MSLRESKPTIRMKSPFAAWATLALLAFAPPSGALAQDAASDLWPAPSSPVAAPGQAVDTGLLFAQPRLALHSESAADTDARRLLGEARFTLQPTQQPGDAGAKPVAAEDDSVALAKKLSNPVASMISVPFQFNYDTGYGPNDADRVVLNVQPVIPFSISEEWNLILRTIVPVIYQDSIATGVDSDFGVGDVTQSFFFSPKEPVGGWILAVGPVALWPTGTEPGIRSEQVGLGPTVLALRQEGGWTYGVLANHIWGVTHSDDHADVNSTFLQPFGSYTWPTATTLTLNTESTYDWTGEQWTVPVNLVVSQLVKFGKQPVQFFVGGRYYADAPDNGPEWGIRFGFTLLFPK